MKRCVPRTADRVTTLLAAAGLGAVGALAAREGLRQGQPDLGCLVTAALFGGMALWLAWRMLCTAGWGFYYDEERVVFALSRSDRREYRWEELSGAEVRFVFGPTAMYFLFADGKRINLLPRMEGCDAFLTTLRQKGVPAAGGIHLGGLGDLGDPPTAARVFTELFGEEFGKGGHR